MRRSSRFSSLALLVGLAIALGSLGASVVVEPLIVAVVVPTVLAIMVLVALSRYLDSSSDDSGAEGFILRWTLGSFAAHLLAGLVISSVGGAVTFFGGDALTYHQGATGVLAHWTDGEMLPRLPGGRNGFYYFLAAIYWIFGLYPAAGLAINAMFAAALVPVVADTSYRLFGTRAVRFAPPLVVALPGLFLWTSQLLKEAPILFFIAVAVNSAIRINERSSPAALACLAAACALLFNFRGPVGLVVVASLILALAASRRHLMSGLTTGVTAVLLIGLLVVVFGVGYSGYSASVSSDLEEVNTVRRDLAQSASSGFQLEADVSTPRGAVEYLPVGMVSFGFGPFPWQVGSGRQLLGLVDAAVWWALLPSLWRGQKLGRLRAGRRTLIVVLPALAIWILLSLVIANYGTVVRERMQIVIVVAPLIALGLSERASRAAETERSAELAR